MRAAFNLEGGSFVKRQKKKAPRITLRLTEEEFTKLQHLSSGISVSAYIRKCVFGKATAPRKVRSRVPVKNQKALAQILGKLSQSGIANNFNQIAYQANCGSLLLDEATEDEITLGHELINRIPKSVRL